jgi:phosphohistidine phosphatase
MATGFPTGAVAVFEVPGAWSDLDLASARLIAFHVGRAGG